MPPSFHPDFVLGGVHVSTVLVGDPYAETKLFVSLLSRRAGLWNVKE